MWVEDRKTLGAAFNWRVRVTQTMINKEESMQQRRLYSYYQRSVLQKFPGCLGSAAAGECPQNFWGKWLPVTAFRLF